MPRLISRELIDAGLVHSLMVKLRGFPDPFFFTVASEEKSDWARSSVEETPAGFLCFRDERGSKRYIGINYKFIQYVHFRFDPRNVTRVSKRQEDEPRDVRLWFEGEAEPYGFGSDSEPHDTDIENTDWGDLEAVWHALETHDGDEDVVSFEFVDDESERVVFRDGLHPAEFLFDASSVESACKGSVDTQHRVTTPGAPATACHQDCRSSSAGRTRNAFASCTMTMRLGSRRPASMPRRDAGPLWIPTRPHRAATRGQPKQPVRVLPRGPSLRQF